MRRILDSPSVTSAVNDGLRIVSVLTRTRTLTAVLGYVNTFEAPVVLCAYCVPLARTTNHPPSRDEIIPVIPWWLPPTPRLDDGASTPPNFGASELKGPCSAESQ